MKRKMQSRCTAGWQTCAWVAASLLLCGALAGMLAGDADAIPNCNQINTGFCQGGSQCFKSIVFGPCIDGIRTWKCYWGGPECDYYGPVSYCHCDNTPGCDCLLEGAPITLADGTTKPVEKIQAGERVLSYDEITATTLPAEVVRVHAPYMVDHYYIINGKIRATENHPVLSRGRWVAVGDLSVGDLLTGPDRAAVPVFSIEKIEAEATVYNIQVSSGVYVAHGVVVHNKEDCLEYVQYYPY